MPSPSVSLGVSMVSAATVPSSFNSTFSVTSPPKPCTVAVSGLPEATPPPLTMVLTALMAAVEVKVAPVSASMPSSP